MISIFYIYQTLHYTYNDLLESYIIYYNHQFVPFSKFSICKNSKNGTNYDNILHYTYNVSSSSKLSEISEEISDKSCLPILGSNIFLFLV